LTALWATAGGRLINFLNTQPLNQLCGDFELIAPEGLTSMYNIGFSGENVQTDNLNRRMNNVSCGQYRL